jgi:hypothetical protein
MSPQISIGVDAQGLAGMTWVGTGVAEAHAHRPNTAWGTMTRESDDRVRAIAGEIERYLAEHPEAADNAAGIHRWWLPLSFADAPLRDVQAALDSLVQAGRIERTPTADGAFVYRSGPRR